MLGARERHLGHGRGLHGERGKTDVHSLEPEDLAALTMEASAMAGVPLAGTSYTVGIEDYHHL